MRLFALLAVLQLSVASLHAQSVTTNSRNAFSFEWRELQQIAIDDARLPSDAIVVTKPGGPWPLHRVQILGAILLIALQAALIGMLLWQRAGRRRTERQLLDSQQRYSLASAAGAVGVWDWNLQTNQLFIDARLKAILGFADDEISTRPDDWGSRVHPDDLPATSAALKAHVDGATASYEVEHRMLHKDGSVKWMLSRGSAVRGADGRVLRLVGTKVDITDRKKSEDAIREGEAVLRASYREIHDLAGRLITSQEGERARIARDLHDDLSQQLAGMSIALSTLKRRLLAIPETGELPDDVASLQQRAIGLADNIRRLSHDLHPSVLQHTGLVPALRAHCADLQRWHDVVVTLSADGDFDSTEAAVRLCLYRVAQEALRNVVTHAFATRAEVRLTRVAGEVELMVADDGTGFDITTSGKKARGLGLVSISERVRLAGGTVSIVTELNRGTRLRVQMPANGNVLAPQ